MKEQDLVCIIRKSNPYKQISKATKDHKIFENILNKEFKSGLPFGKILTDITYLSLKNGTKAYLSAAKYCITGEIISYTLRSDLKLELSLDMLDNIDISKLIPGALIHSDQGFHYISPRYSKKVNQMGLMQSMSRRGNCIDNSSMESFFGHFKDEFNASNYDSMSSLKKAIDKYMIYYNQQRKQWNKKKMTPINYRNHLLSI